MQIPEGALGDMRLPLVLSVAPEIFGTYIPEFVPNIQGVSKVSNLLIFDTEMFTPYNNPWIHEPFAGFSLRTTNKPPDLEKAIQILEKIALTDYMGCHLWESMAQVHAMENTEKITIEAGIFLDFLFPIPMDIFQDLRIHIDFGGDDYYEVIQEGYVYGGDYRFNIEFSAQSNSYLFNNIRNHNYFIEEFNWIISDGLQTSIDELTFNCYFLEIQYHYRDVWKRYEYTRRHSRIFIRIGCRKKLKVP